MESKTKVLTDLSVLYAKTYEAKVIAQRDGLNDEAAALNQKMVELSAVTDKVRATLSQEWQSDALKLHGQFRIIHDKVNESLNDMNEHIDVANHIASILDFVEEVIVLAAKLAP